MIKVNFNYTDRFNQLCTMEHTYDKKVLESRNDIELLTEGFIMFLRSTGFRDEDIQKYVLETMKSKLK
ncbi:TPA: hypothetical protein ACXDAY_002147 [Clostridium botulinum]|uniref:hypothetical protein n=1 Tax=Clostridium botulinum TaxID=1491 RepID=UPI0004647B08|nr:hypothetical protein [Clostridium botulinum]APH20873.1 hypothetical protein NPD1_4223 [Clostridium botulinum]APQ71373.1 hypothetical protein RSJ8_4180 [Clostridium botulinum]APR02504.1 hypothetical protein RSJ2_4041 [Clostridium botulinum]AUN01561.1 hypothetical protein RSJ19_00840 [Clostridium botulinum]MBN3359279.1 hypothetical protein [Clostridium botulinum]